MTIDEIETYIKDWLNNVENSGCVDGYDFTVLEQAIITDDYYVDVPSLIKFLRNKENNK